MDGITYLPMLLTAPLLGKNLSLKCLINGIKIKTGIDLKGANIFLNIKIALLTKGKNLTAAYFPSHRNCCNRICTLSIRTMAIDWIYYFAALISNSRLHWKIYDGIERKSYAHHWQKGTPLYFSLICTYIYTSWLLIYQEQTWKFTI